MEDLKSTGGFSVSQGVQQRLAGDFVSGRASEAQTSAAIAHWHQHSGELLCPHSAIGVHVAEEMRDSATPMITLATAHPAKFPAAVEAASGLHPPLPERMADLYDRPERLSRVANDLGALKKFIKERITS